MIGRTLGPYEIVDELGSGGMGVVYKARDPRLDRFVAIKVLRGEATSDSERKRRFVQEAKAASALNHPNIVTIHDIAREDGVDFIVMEYVAGHTLDHLISRGGMKLRDLLNYATQAADALARAHAAGILHRDLKPSNLMVTDDGRVKILDFGLAKLSVRALASTETTLHADPVRTGDGLVVGTPAYMSPEQAEGKPVDARSDIFSFGAVLYEMATGLRAFRGDSTASTLAAVLTFTPTPPGQTVPTLPRELDRIIVRCLRKEPGRRFQVMADLAVELDEIKTESSERIEAVQVPPSRRRRWPWVAAAGVAFLVIAAAAWSYRTGTAGSGPPMVTSLTTYGGVEAWPSLSPDGTQVAFVWNGEQRTNDDIYVKPLDAVTPLRLTSDPLPDTSPAWSPSGREIAFVRLQAGGRGTVYISPPIPGSERKIADVRPTGQAGQSHPRPTWTPDGRWLVVAELATKDGENGLFLIGVESGERRAIATAPLSTVRYVAGYVSPAGETIAYVGCEVAGMTACDLWTQPLGEDLSAQGAPRQVTSFRGSVNGVAWMPDGRSILVSASTTQYAFSHLWQVPVAGAAPERLDWVGAHVLHASVSKTGRLVATRDLTTLDIWRFDLSSPGTPPSIHPVSSTLPDVDPEFSPDGSRIAFSSARSGQDQEIWIARSDGTGAMLLTRGSAGRNRGSPRWSHDSTRIVFDSSSEDGVRRAYVTDATGGAPRLVSDYHANFPSWSHDDQWIYFGSNRTGRMEVWRVPAAGGTPEQVTREGGNAPRASADGRTLYYRRGPTVYGKPLGGGPDQPIVEGATGITGAYLPSGTELFHVARPDPSRPILAELRATDVRTRKTRSICRFEATNFSGLTVSPDGKTVLLSVFTAAADLLLVENFR
jgi:eukaryotic-like serine/threonine-protein kinase